MHLAVPSTSDQVSAHELNRLSGKYLVFELNGEEFCVPVLKIREILGMQEITHVPHTPPHVLGVFNLRGKVIPIVDLRLRFGLPQAEYTQRTCVIVAQTGVESNSSLTGVVVDGVAEVLNIGSSDIETTPVFGDGVSIPYLLGMAKVKGRVKLLLNIEEILTNRELHGLDSFIS